jgi:Protein of unknown function (DUF1800)
VPTQLAEWIAAARLLRRTGFGASGPVVDGVVGIDPSAYLDRILASDPNTDPGAARTPIPMLRPPARPSADAASDALAAYEQKRAAQMRTLTSWWLGRMATANEPGTRS